MHSTHNFQSLVSLFFSAADVFVDCENTLVHCLYFMSSYESNLWLLFTGTSHKNAESLLQVCFVEGCCTDYKAFRSIVICDLGLKTNWVEHELTLLGMLHQMIRRHTNNHRKLIKYVGWILLIVIFSVDHISTLKYPGIQEKLPQSVNFASVYLMSNMWRQVHFKNGLVYLCVILKGFKSCRLCR